LHQLKNFINPLLRIDEVFFIKKEKDSAGAKNYLHEFTFMFYCS